MPAIVENHLLEGIPRHPMEGLSDDVLARLAINEPAPGMVAQPSHLGSCETHPSPDKLMMEIEALKIQLQLLSSQFLNHLMEAHNHKNNSAYNVAVSPYTNFLG